VHLKDMPPPQQAQARAILRREFVAFLTTMTAADNNGWPTISDQELVDALSDSLLQMGQQRGKGVALLQTLVHELQDRINSQLN